MRVSVWMAAAVLLGGSTMMQAQTNGTVKDDLFAGTEKFAANASSVTEVDMDPDSLDMVNGHNSTRARRTVLSVVHTYSYDKPGMYNMTDVEAFRNKLNTGDWHCSVHVRELKSGESTDVCRKHRTDDLEESAIITVEPKELTFIHTIKRPATPGKTGGGDSLLMLPGFGAPGMDGLPRSAWSAEMRANAAEMRAQAMIDRAEMAGMPGMRLDLFGEGGPMLYRAPGLDAEQLHDLTRQLRDMPSIDMQRFGPEMQRQLQQLQKRPEIPKLPKQPSSAPAAPVAPEPPLHA